MNILNTRPEHQSSHLIKLLEGMGATIAHLPVITIRPTPFHTENTNHFDHLIFLSANAVNCFFDKVSHPHHRSIICIGPATKKALEKFNIRNIILPVQFNSEGILALPLLQNINNQTIALICGENPKPLLQQTLQQRGAQIKLITCYRRVPAAYHMKIIFPELQSQKIDMIISASLESLTALTALFHKPEYHSWLHSKTLCVISEKMKAVATKSGFRSVIIAENATDEAIVVAISQYFRVK